VRVLVWNQFDNLGINVSSSTDLGEDPSSPVVSSQSVLRTVASSGAAKDDSSYSIPEPPKVHQLRHEVEENFSLFDKQPMSDSNSLLLIPTIWKSFQFPQELRSLFVLTSSRGLHGKL